MPCPMTADTAVAAESTSGKMPKNVRTDSGTGRSRTAILVAMPKVSDAGYPDDAGAVLLPF